MEAVESKEQDQTVRMCGLILLETLREKGMIANCPRGVNPLPDMPILGSSNSAANKDTMSKNIRQMGIQLSD